MSALTLWIVSCRQSLRTRVGRTERGATLVEYALLVTLIAVVCIIAISIVGNNASANFSNVGSAIQ